MKKSFIALLITFTLFTACKTYESPMLHTAKYQVETSGWSGHYYLTDNYTIEGGFIVLHGWSGKYDDFTDAGENRTLSLSSSIVSKIGDNPDYIETK